MPTCTYSQNPKKVNRFSAAWHEGCPRQIASARFSTTLFTAVSRHMGSGRGRNALAGLLDPLFAKHEKTKASQHVAEQSYRKPSNRADLRCWDATPTLAYTNDPPGFARIGRLTMPP